METKKPPTVLDPIITALRTALAVHVDPKRSPWSQTHVAEFLDSMVYEAERAADKIRAQSTRHEAMRAALERLASEAQKYVEGYEDDSKRAARSFCQGCYSRPTMLEDEVEKARALLDAEKPEAGRGSA